MLPYFFEGRWGGWMISCFDCSSPFCFLLIEFHNCFSILLIKYYHIMFIIIVFWLGCDRPSGLIFSCPLCLFLYSRLSSCLLRLFLYLISFLLFPCARVWEIIRAWVPIAILNGTCFFPTVQLQVQNVYLERKTRNSCAPVNLCL